MKTTTTTTQTPAQTKITRLCKILLSNAQFTNRFVNKTDHASIFEEWKALLNIIKSSAFDYYKTLASQDEESENAKASEKALYTSIKNLLAFVGDIPTKDGKESTKINSKVLFYDAIAFAVNHKAKLEIEDLTKAREVLKSAKIEYKQQCLTENGIVKNGLNQAFIDKYTKAIEDAQKTVDKLLNKSNASIFATSETKIGTFAKHFEIALRKAIMHNYNFTEKQAKEEKQKQKETRKKNRAKAK